MSASALPIPSLTLDAAGGLQLGWRPREGLPLNCGAVRVALAGQHKFVVWNVVDSGESAPLWSEPDLNLDFFASGTRLDRIGERGWRATSVHSRGTAVLTAELNDRDELELGLSLTAGGRPLPVGSVELRLAGIDPGPGATYLSGHSYGGRTFTGGPLEPIHEPGVNFTHGCVGLAIPLLCLHQPASDAGLRIEFMMTQRPSLWLRPGRVLALQWGTERLLAPGETHVYGGRLRFKGFRGASVAQLRAWRDEAADRYGLAPVRLPAWVRRMRMIEFNMNPTNTRKGFTRLDDPRCLEMLKRWRGWGYDTIFSVSQFEAGENWLSPPDYDASAKVGGPEAEQQYLRWAHELGFRVGLWLTTVGVDRNSAAVKEHPEWFTRRANGELFYAWDSRPDNNFFGYAPDGDPLSLGWRAWLKDQATRVCGRGYDWIYIDGCIPRASNHARWAWPGESRNAVEDQVIELAAHVASLPGGKVLVNEDEGLFSQVATHCTQGRYHGAPPLHQKAYWDLGMGGGPETGIRAPEPIRPELARDYLLMRYASLLPGVPSHDMLEGYCTEVCRPWIVQSFVGGTTFKTHSEYVDDAETLRPWPGTAEPAGRELDPAWRRRGLAEFLSLVRLVADEPELLREAPLSIEGVAIEGDAAVVGMLRPTADRCLLGILNFGGRAAEVRIRLAEPGDIPAIFRAQGGQPHRRRWRAAERMRSMADEAPAAGGVLGPESSLSVALAPYGFRLFHLTPVPETP